MTSMADQENTVNHEVPPDTFSVLLTAADEAASDVECRRFDVAMETATTTAYRLGRAGGMREAVLLLRDLPPTVSLGEAAGLIDEHAESWRQVALGGLGPQARAEADRLTQ